MEDLKKESILKSEVNVFLTNHPLAALKYLKDTFPWVDPKYLFGEWVSLKRGREKKPNPFQKQNSDILEDFKKEPGLKSEVDLFLTNHPFAAFKYLKDTFPWADPIYLLSEWVCLTRERKNYPLVFTQPNPFQKLKSLFHNNDISLGYQLKNFLDEKIKICKNQQNSDILRKLQSFKSLIIPRLNDLNFLHLLNMSENCLGEKDYTKSENYLIEANEIYSNSNFTPNFKHSNPFNFENRVNNIIEHEKEFNIQNILMDFANKYPRILISEIVKKSKLETSTVEGIVKKLISSGQIKAIFDDESRGLEFQFAIDEIDQLMKTYQDWEGKNAYKKK